MGLLSGFSPASTGTSREPTLEERAQRAGFNLADLTTPDKELERKEGPSPLGFLENMLGDVREIGTGLTSLVSAAGADAFDFGREVLSGGEAETGGYRLAEMGRRLPEALRQDYSARYGGQGLDEVGRQLYENPLSYLGDALTVATGGGYAAAKGAQVAAKVPNVAKGLSSLAEASALQKAGMPGMAALTGADDVSRVVSTVDKILPGLKTGGWAGGTKPVVNPLTGRVVQRPQAFNPTRRMFDTQVVQRALTKPVGNLQREVTMLEQTVDMLGGELAPSKLKNDLLMKRNALRLAEEAGGARILRPKVAEWKIARVTDRLIGGSGAAHVAERDGISREFKEVLGGLDEAELEAFISKAQIDLPTWDGRRMPFEAIPALMSKANPTNREAAFLSAIQEDLGRIARMEMGEVPPSFELRARSDLRDELAAAHPELSRGDLNEMVEAAMPARIEELMQFEIEAAKRYVSGLSEGVVGDGLGIADPLINAIDDARLVIHRNLTTPYLNNGGVYRTIFERGLKPMNKVTSDRWDFDSALEAFDLDDLLVSQGHKSPVYVPHIETLNLRVRDFLMPYRMTGMRKAAETGRHGFKRSEGQVFDRWLEGVGDAMVTNPLDAYARRGAEIARHKEAIYFLDRLLSETGRPIEALDDLADWETTVNIDAAKLIIRKRAEAADNAAESVDMLDETMDFEGVSAVTTSAAARALADLPDEMADALARRGALYAVPKVVADQMDNLMKHRFGFKARMFFDGPINVWRNLALYARPAFYLNNFFGNTTFLKLQGGTLTGVVRQLSPRYRSMVREAIGDALTDVETGFFDTVGQRSTHFGQHQDRPTARLATLVKQSKPGRGTGKVRDKLQRFNQIIEDAFRRESFLTAAQRQLARSNVQGVGTKFFRTQTQLETIMTKGADEGNLARWLDETNKTMNDYTALSPFERNVIRRGFIPFWAFYKHAAKTLFRLPFEHPAKAGVIRQLGDLSKEMSREVLGGEVEPFLEGMFTIGGTQPGGEALVYNPQSQNPLSDIVSEGSVFKNLAEQLNPVWKVGIEQATGQELFTGKKFTDPDTLAGFGRTRQFDIDPETGVQLNPEGARPGLLRHIARQVPGYSQLEDLWTGGAQYSATGQPILDAETGLPLYPTDPNQELAQYLGFPTYQANPTEYRTRLQEDRLAALAAWLTRQGY